jgi:hypothetical protein
MSGIARRRLVLLQGGGEGSPLGASPRRAIALSIVPGQAEPPPEAPTPPADAIDAARSFRRALEARVASPLEHLLS